MLALALEEAPQPMTTCEIKDDIALTGVDAGHLDLEHSNASWLFGTTPGGGRRIDGIDRARRVPDRCGPRVADVKTYDLTHPCTLGCHEQRFPNRYCFARSRIRIRVQRMSESKRRASWVDRTARMREAAQGFVEKTAEDFKEPLPTSHDPDLHGPLVQKAEVDERPVELYEGGFIRAVGLFGGGKFERLVSITYREQTFTQDQSAVGGFLTNAFTAGMASTESVKTTGTITVVTEEKTYSGKIKPKHGRAFEGFAARKGLGSHAPAPAPAGSPAAPDIADQIKKLADLHAAGILTDEEFSTKKADLLNRM